VSTMLETAEHFLVACETGKGWDGCKEYCHPDASFSAQASTLAEVDTVEAYTNWMSGLLGIIPTASTNFGRSPRMPPGTA
jgi:hypothetical protein